MTSPIDRTVPYHHRRALAVLALLLGLAFPVSARAATQIKMATLAPEGSIWAQVLREMGSDWQQATGGEVKLTLYPGGVAGDEPDLVRKMRVGQLHAAALTMGGLALLDDGFAAFQVPMFIDSYEELFAVLDAMRPELEKRLAAKGFVLLHWGHGGWIHLFSQQPVRTIADLGKQKIFTAQGNDEMVQLFRRQGIDLVPLATTDVMTGLQSGLIDAMPTTPLAALSLQWFRQTPYMQDLGFAPLVGATVVAKRTWDSLSPAVQKQLRAAAAKAEARLAKEVPQQDQRAVEEMKSRGLQVVTVPESALAGWRKMADDIAAHRREGLEAKELLDVARRARDAHRAAASAGGGAAP